MLVLPLASIEDMNIAQRRLLVLWLPLSVFFLFLFGVTWSRGSTLGTWSGIKINGMTAIDTNERADVKPNAVLVMIVPPPRMTEAMMTILNIEDRFNRRLKYPYVLLTEANITKELQDKVAWITEGRASFAELSDDLWGAPDFLEKDKIDQSLHTLGFSLGYRSMCRFFSGFVWRHPAVEKYDWIWRLDSDIEFHCDVPYDPFIRMRSAQALYGFVQITGDAIYIQPSLAANVSAFLSTHRHLIPPDVNHAFSWRDVEKALQGDAGNDQWARRVFYDNWEISHRSVWESDIYTSFFEYLDRAGGFFYERWGDAPVHSYGISMALRADQVMQFDDMGYQHKGWPYKCPATESCACVPDSKSEHFHSRADEWFNAVDIDRGRRD